MSGAAEGHAEIPPSDSVLFILVCFGCGIFIRLCLRWTKIPYTAMLLLWGLAIGFLQLGNPMTVAFTNTLRLWLSMEPHLLLLIFLPIIGFSAAVAQEPHMLRKSWGQIMLLAWPGVVIQFLLIALCAKYFFPYGWTWPEAFLFGAMLSATDPVAVVAVLQEVGASQKLACVIDGESLMNDGSALVIFLLLQKIVEGEQVTVGGAVAQFCLLAVVGMVLGVAFGAATSWLLDNIFKDPTLTTVVTLVSAYSSYYTADRLVGASGLLAVVCNGFTMSLIGGRQITLRVEDAMHGFWSVLEWGANTILFLWMGIVLAIVLPPSHAETAFTNQPIVLEARDAGYVVVLYLWLQVARAVLLLVCWIPFGYTGYPLSWRSALVMVWGGLRGAVGMVMALFIFLDTKIHDASFKSYCIFYMGTMAFFTVLINGGLTKPLLQWLGFMSYTPEQLGTLAHVIEDMDDIRAKRLQALAPDEVLGEPEPDAVKVWSRVPTEAVLAQAAANTVRPALNTNGPAYAAAVAAGLDPQLLYDYRCRVLNMVKAHYAEVYDQHLLGTLQARTLQAVTDAALDEAGERLKDWKLLEPSCVLRGLPRLMQALKLHRMSGMLVQAATYSQSLSNLQLLVGFIHAHRHAQEVLRQHIRAVEAQCGVAEASTPPTTPNGEHLSSSLKVAYTTDDMAGTRGGSEAMLVLQESEDEVAAALVLVESMTKSHPSLPAWLRSKQAAGEILYEQHAFLQQLGDAGLVQPREMLLLEELMLEQFKALLRANTGVAAAVQYTRSRPPLNILPLFDNLGDNEVAQLMKHCSKQAQMQDVSARHIHHDLHWKVYYPEQLIAGLEQRIEHVVIITKGAVRMRFPIMDGPHARTEEHTVVASVGDPLGVCELMLGLPRMAELTADSMVQALLVPTSTFLQLVSATAGIRVRAWQATAAQLAAQHHHILGQHKQLAPLNIFFRNCTLERVQPGDNFQVPRTALLLTGSVAALLPLPADNPALQKAKSASAVAAGGLISSSFGSFGSLPGLGNGTQQQQQPDCASPDNLSGSSPTGGSPRGSSPSGSISSLNRICEHPAQPLALPESYRDSLQRAASPQAGEVAGRHVLAAPAELPPGEFKCVCEAMVLQVPRGPQLPTDLETTTYQAQVLSKGSILLAPARGHGGSTTGASGGQEGNLTKLSKPLVSPFKSAIARVSRMAGLTRTASDAVPNMPFLQGALASMRAQQQLQAQQDGLRHSTGGAAGRTHQRHIVAEGRSSTDTVQGSKHCQVGGTATLQGAAAESAAATAAADIEMGTLDAGAASNSSCRRSACAETSRHEQQGGLARSAAQGATALGAVELPRATDVLHSNSSNRDTLRRNSKGGAPAAAVGALGGGSLSRRSGGQRQFLA